MGKKKTEKKREGISYIVPPALTYVFSGRGPTRNATPAVSVRPDAKLHMSNIDRSINAFSATFKKAPMLIQLRPCNFLMVWFIMIVFVGII